MLCRVHRSRCSSGAAPGSRERVAVAGLRQQESRGFDRVGRVPDAAGGIGADQQAMEAGGVGGQDGISPLVLQERLDGAGGGPHHPPLAQDQEGVDERRPIPVPAGVELGLGREGLGQQPDGGHRPPDQLGADQAEQLETAPVERRPGASRTAEGPGGIGLGRPLGQSGEAGTDVDGELPPAGRLEPVGQPLVVADDQSEAIGVGVHIEDGRGQELPDGPGPLAGMLVGQRRVRHRRPRQAGPIERRRRVRVRVRRTG